MLAIYLPKHYKIPKIIFIGNSSYFDKSFDELKEQKQQISKNIKIIKKRKNIQEDCEILLNFAKFV